MKKTLIIGGGILAVVCLFLIWVYLLIFGTPKPVTEFFTDFSLFGGSSETGTETPFVPVVPDAPTVVDVQTEKLRQLTTRPVIGFREQRTIGATTSNMRYAEAGTGHIYQINLATGEEIRLSNTTIPNAESAVFSPDGNYAAIRSGFGNDSDIILLTLKTLETSTAETLSVQMSDFAFSVTGELLYTVTTTEGTTGRSINLTTRISQDLFTIPFQSITMIWSTDGITPHYVYPKATSKLNGYLYAIKNGTIARQPISGFGLVASANPYFTIHTKLNGTEPVSFISTLATNVVATAPILFEPHKCAFASFSTSTMYCGYELTEYSYNYPDDWYQGTRSFSDRIWRINLAKNSASQLVIPPQVAGRDIDITDLEVGAGDRMIYFMNKNDKTLWLYEI